MGYGNGYDFSSCSISFLNTHLYTNGYSSCLSDTGDSFSTSGWNLNSINCITQISSRSGTGDDDTTSVSCPSGYTLTGCSGYTAWQSSDGSWISGNTCYARNGHEGNGIWAYARCCPISASCTNVRSSQSGSDDEDTAVAKCTNGYTLTGCTVDTYWTNIDGSHPGYNFGAGKNAPGELLSTGDVCLGYTSGGGSVWSTARCCSSNNGYALQCRQIWGSMSGSGDDDTSSVSCPSGYFMSGCSVMTHWGNLDGAKFSTSGNTCYGYNGNEGGGVWAVGICCSEYSSSRRRRRRRRRLADGDPEYENVYGSNCNGYECLKMSGVQHNEYNVTNGKWIEHGCYHGMAYYRLEQKEDLTNSNNSIFVKEYYVYKSNLTNNWHLFTNLDDSDSVGFCTENDIIDCSGKWYFDVNGHWEQEMTSVVSMCLNDNDDNDDNNSSNYHENTYGDQVCIYNDGSLWKNGIATFWFNGYSSNGYPYFYYHYNSGNSTTVYYLHYLDYISGSSIHGDIYQRKWIISESSIDDIVGVAYCEKIDLNDCVYGHWKVLIFDSEFGDEALYQVSESMGYDNNCHDSTDDSSSSSSNSNYCDRENSCALWNSELLIQDSSGINILCSDSFVECITEFLIDDVSDVTANKKDCDNEYYQVFIDFQVSFSNENTGAQLYTQFKSNIVKYGQECADSNDDANGINVQFVSSNVTLCNNCQSFLNQSKACAFNAKQIILVCAFVNVLVALFAF